MTVLAERIEAPWLAAEVSRRVMLALAAHGRPARFVGGCVRDALLDPEADIQDIDIATPELPERAMALLAAAGLRAMPTGLRHGTVSLHFPGRRFEITTLRRDVACDGRHAEVEFTDDFDADAARRDFTINAMSCEPDGTLHDPMGGRADLAAGRVRFVGDARRRIAEDHLRILRFFRFQARFGRGAPDEEALSACAAMAEGVDGLSGERVRQELWLILLGPRPAATLALMRSAGVLARVVPGAVSLDRLERLAEPDALLRLAALIRPSSGCAGGGAGGSPASFQPRARAAAGTGGYRLAGLRGRARRRSGWPSTGSGHGSTPTWCGSGRRRAPSTAPWRTSCWRWRRIGGRVSSRSAVPTCWPWACRLGRSWGGCWPTCGGRGRKRTSRSTARPASLARRRRPLRPAVI